MVSTDTAKIIKGINEMTSSIDSLCSELMDVSKAIEKGFDEVANAIAQVSNTIEAKKVGYT